MAQRHYQQPQGATGQQTEEMGQQAGSRMGQQTGQMGGMSQQTGQASQMGQRTGRMGQMGMRLSDVETPQQRAAVEDITRAIQVCGWCADQCIQEADPNMIECIRLCEDVTELGETVLALLPRNSRYADSILQTFQQALQECGQECGRHQHGHCQECAEVLGWTSESVQQLLGSYGQQTSMAGQ